VKNTQLGVLLVCFDGKRTAGKAHRNLARQLRAEGDEVLDVAVIEVDANHKGAAYDPHRMLWGTVTAAIVYALCGFAGAYGAWSVVFWAAVGGVGGLIICYYYVRHVTKSELGRISAGLPAQSSALLMWVATDDARHVLETAATEKPSVASLAIIEADVTAHVFTDPADPVEPPPHSAAEIRDADTTMLSLVLVRYADPDTAKQVALQPPADSPLEVEMMMRTDADGRRHASDPYLGVKAWALSTLLWWGGFGLGVGALSGFAGGGGILGGVEGAVSTGILWGLVGLIVGAIYGLEFGREHASRRLKRLGSLVVPGTSILMAWVDAANPFTESILDEYAKPGSKRLILNFNSIEHGAVLEAV
jgi:hypothetical protein